MITPRIWSSVVVLALVAAGSSANLRKVDSAIPESRRIPALQNACVITNDVRRLVDFYEPVLALQAKWSGADYAEFPTGVGVLAIFSAEAQEKYIPGAAVTAKNKSLILEFKVADVDQEYARLQNLVKLWVKPPSTQPWGTRSIYFRDPDGNLVDFYTPAKPQ
jgi:catechol 2,3-dioxygenase-like lactoylglutathione lyase family enzyme